MVGHAAAAPSNVMNSRRFIVAPDAEETTNRSGITNRTGRANVRFGSEADMCSALVDVRFTPESDRESGFGQPVMSALHPKADMCSARGYVLFGPIADIPE
jgi:hypothetical protein